MARAALAAPSGRDAKVAELLEDLMRELQRRPLRSDVRVCVSVAGRPAYLLRCGRLLQCSGEGDGDSPQRAAPREGARSVAGASAPEGGEAPDDVRIAFRDQAALADIVLRTREALSTGDLSGTVSLLLSELAVPRWAGGSQGVEVSGTAALARLLWHACFCREQDAARESSGHDWANDDLSSGWVMVHSVSPCIQDRVDKFQQDIERASERRRRAAPPAGAQTPTASADTAPDAAAGAAAEEAAKAAGGAAQLGWLDELIQDLNQAAQQFKETGLGSSSCVGGGILPIEDVSGGDASGASAAPASALGACSRALAGGGQPTTPSAASAGAATAATPQRRRAAPPTGVMSFI